MTHAYPELKVRLYTVLMVQFKGSIEKVAAEIKQVVGKVSDLSAEFQCVTFSGKENPKFYAQTGGMLIDSKTRCATMNLMVDIINEIAEDNEFVRVPILLVDESDAFAVGQREYIFNQVYKELQLVCSGLVFVTATIFHCLLDVAIQP